MIRRHDAMKCINHNEIQNRKNTINMHITCLVACRLLLPSSISGLDGARFAAGDPVSVGLRRGTLWSSSLTETKCRLIKMKLFIENARYVCNAVI